MFKYNGNSGGYSKLNDKVVILHTNSQLDGVTGELVGYAASENYVGIVLLDTPLATGEKAVVMPIVCLSLKEIK